EDDQRGFHGAKLGETPTERQDVRRSRQGCAGRAVGGLARGAGRAGARRRPTRRWPPRAAPAAPGRATVAQGSGIRESESMKPSRRPGHASTLEAIMEYSTKPNGGRAAGRSARRDRRAALVAAGAALALAAATPALAQEREETRASGQSCY